MAVHELIDPTHENGWSSWHCVKDGTTCSSDNPCDCCTDAPSAEEG